MSAAPVASLAGVTKHFGATVALDGLDLELTPGSLVALLGPNGAGKTTALSLLVGLRRPDGGTARLFGGDPLLPSSRRRLGCTPQDAAFPGTLRVRELLALVGAHFERRADPARLAVAFGLGELLHRQAGGLSGGERRRLAVALAFAGSPELVVLDEPTTGLDVDARGSTWEALRRFVGAGGSVLLTTHYLEEAEALADTVVVIDRGRAVASGGIEAIRRRAGGGRITFRSEPLPAALRDGAVDDGAIVTIHAPDPSATVRALVRAGARLEGLAVQPFPLEQALRRLSEDGP